MKLVSMLGGSRSGDQKSTYRRNEAVDYWIPWQCTLIRILCRQDNGRPAVGLQRNMSTIFWAVGVVCHDSECVLAAMTL